MLSYCAAGLLALVDLPFCSRLYCWQGDDTRCMEKGHRYHMSPHTLCARAGSSASREIAKGCAS